MDTSPVRPPGPETTGRRISVRFRTDDGGASDVVGRVIGTAPALRLERRDGTVASVDPATVLIWRLVPDRPVRTRRATATPVDRLARIASLGWPAAETHALDGWELRASGGFTKRANSAAAFGPPEQPLADALAEVTGFYRDRGLAPLVQVETDSPVDQQIRRDHHWRPVPGGDTLVHVAQLDRRWPVSGDLTITAAPDTAWLDAYGPPATHRAAALAVLSGPPAAAHLRLGGAVARVVVTGEWAGLSALRVPEEHRRSGLGRRLVTACLGWAVEHGADKAYVQVTLGNEAAERLYRSFGFVDHHAYRYLTPG
ncbi:MAG: GNAT family N-acetyltransferase [Aeromicrobium sp.]|uniref:GNAT family N-acetyltransferase n=1 Tax=Aeromicrobium sp. TaxID=1871063 RepID=UPI0039E6AB24